jgi:DNA topoisomerase-1
LAAARSYVKDTYGPDYLPEKQRVHKVKAGAQDAHEAIRPVDVTVTPDMVKEFLPAEQYNLYRIIWARFLASQMANAQSHDTTVILECANTQWQAKGVRITFPGFLEVYTWAKNADTELPRLSQGQGVTLKELKKEQKFTQPPARYSEATLVRELEQQGIGRPSTYAGIISTLLDRTYIKAVDRHLVPTDLGRAVCGQLTEHFGKLMDVGFTAQMEADLDKVAEGSRGWIDLLRDFSVDFNPALDSAAKNMKNLKGGMPTDLVCPDCGSPLVVRFGKAGDFLACSGYPACKYSTNFTRGQDGHIEAVADTKEAEEKVGTCPQCGRDLLMRKAHAGGRFIGCSGYPDCNYTASAPTGVTCPKCGQGMIVERSSRRGKLFYSCDRYPQCAFARWARPVPEACPKCGAPYLMERKSRMGTRIVCAKRECGYVKDEEDA